MRTLLRLFLLVIVLGLLGGLAFYERPLWVQRQTIHLGLFLAHVHSNYVMTPEGRVHYYEAEPAISGGGVPLVLVHGLGDSSESWGPMLKRLKQAGFHVYAPDLLGYGRSPKPADSDYSMATQAKFVTDFIQALGLQKTDIGGWSMGGWVTLKVALDHPELIDRVVLYDSAGLGYEPQDAAILFHPADGTALQRLADLLEPHGGQVPAFVRRDALRGFAANQWVIDRSMQSMRSGKDLVDTRLSTLSPPLLIVWGADDQLLPLSVGRQFHDLDPRSELDIVEGCGHLAPKTCPSKVASATADFLKTNPAPSGSVRTLAHMH